MANQKAQPNAIQLTSLLNMQRDKSDTRPYDRFNANNSPLYGSTLSPFWKSEGTADNSETFDRQGNKWTYKNGYLYKDSEKIKALNRYGFKQEIISGDNLYFYTEYEEAGTLHKVKVFSNGDYSFNLSIDDDIALTSDVIAPIYCSCKYVSGRLVNVIVDGRHLWINIFYEGNFVSGTVFSIPTYGFPVIATTPAMTDYIFFQSLPEVGPINKELDNNWSAIYCYRISTNEYFKTKIKTVDAQFSKPVLMDDGWMLHGRVNRFPDSGGSVNVIDRLIYDDQNPTLSGGTLEISVTFSNHSYLFNFLSPAAYSADAMGKSGTIFSPYWARQTTEFLSSPNSPWNAVFDTDLDGYMIHTGYTVMDDTYHLMTPHICRYKQLKDMDGKRGYWSIAYNNGYISGIGYSDECYGALLTDWLDIDNSCLITFTDEFFIYRNNAGDFVKVSVTANPDWRIKLVGDNVIVNTVSEVNAINLEITNDQNFTWAKLYNGDLLLYVANAATMDISSNTPIFADPVMIAAAINPNYEQDFQRVPSAIFPPVICENSTIASAKVPLTPLDVQDWPEVYFSKDGTVPKFWGVAYRNDKELKKVLKFMGLTYPIDSSGNPLLSPSLFTEIIESGVKKDMLINGGSAYPLQYFDSVNPIYLYYLLSGVQDLQDVFILQGSSYGVTDENILLLSYSDSMVSGIDIIAIKKNMRYLGATPYTAYFWSDQNKSIYTFQGDRLLHKLYEANEIGEIYFTSYNSSTYTLYIATDKGIYAVGDCMYKIEINTAYKIEQTEKDVIVFYTDENGDKKYIKLRYDSAPGYERDKLHLCTSIFGAGVNVVSILDTWYMHFFNNGLEEDGEIKLRLETLTNTGRKTEEKTVKVRASDWDKLTNTYYLRYQPQYQRSIGASLDIVSDFPLRDLSVTSQADTLQVGGSV